jgi:hypothetical protein
MTLSAALLPWALVLWVAAMCAGLASFFIALLGRREGVTVGQLWFAGSTMLRTLPALVTPGAARWSRRSAMLACLMALAAVALVLLRAWSGGAA